MNNMFKEFLYWIVEIIAKIHNKILVMNDAYELTFSDKDLHFIIIGIVGMAIFFVVFPLFKVLARQHHEIVIAWIYTFTLIVVITFAIEIGQKVTNTGNMEFADIMFGIVGFLTMFGVYAIIRMIVIGISRLIDRYFESRK